MRHRAALIVIDTLVESSGSRRLLSRLLNGGDTRIQSGEFGLHLNLHVIDGVVDSCS